MRILSRNVKNNTKTDLKSVLHDSVISAYISHNSVVLSADFLFICEDFIKLTDIDQDRI